MSLINLGWSQYFQQQVTQDESALYFPVRISAVRRRSIVALDEALERYEIALTGDHVATDMAVGDFALTDGQRLFRILDRQTEIARKAAGLQAQSQLIAANINTLFITTSCNMEFNEARLERYLAIAVEAGAKPVIVITKKDRPEDIPAQAYKERADVLYDKADVVLINAQDESDIGALEIYCGAGQTIALVGSSGVGKSTIARTLTGEDILVGDIRQEDAKGRHTTTARSMHRMRAGGWLIDTPGMRELSLHNTSEGIATLFEDISELVLQCKFSDCQHKTEPGCAIRAAIGEGILSSDRLERWRKLVDEDTKNSEDIAQSRERGRKFSKAVKSAYKAKRAKRGY